MPGAGLLCRQLPSAFASALRSPRPAARHLLQGHQLLGSSIRRLRTWRYVIRHCTAGITCSETPLTPFLSSFSARTTFHFPSTSRSGRGTGYTPPLLGGASPVASFSASTRISKRLHSPTDLSSPARATPEEATCEPAGKPEQSITNFCGGLATDTLSIE